MREVIRVHYDPPVRTLNGWDMKIAGTETKIEREECDMENNNLVTEKIITKNKYTEEIHD